MFGYERTRELRRPRIASRGAGADHIQLFVATPSFDAPPAQMECRGFMEEQTYRRFVTGTDADGSAVFVDHGDMQWRDARTIGEGTGIWLVWGANERVTLPSDGTHFDYDTAFPPPAGFRYELMRMGPGATFGMHKTATVDIGVVLSGEMWLELDDGAEQMLGPGDFYVQNGTIHAWHNRGTEPCIAAIVLVGANAEGDDVPR
jgi:quercetin dioxygenase-like cupin family protein